MILYHGSTVVVKKPKILKTDRRLDFGKGFYLTSSYKQAVRWTELKAKRLQCKDQVISIFAVEEERLQSLQILQFETVSKEWLQYVLQNRMNPTYEDTYDLVIGPVADDRTMPVLKMYFAGLYDEQETMKRLLPQKLNDQYDFKTETAVQELIFQEARFL